MFAKWFRKKHQKRVANDYESLESYAVRINSAKILVDKDQELLEALDLLQQDLHYNVATGNRAAVKELNHITGGIDQILKTLRSDNWDRETVLKKIQVVRADISMHSAHNIK